MTTLDWQARAACRDDPYFGQDPDEDAEVCAVCPVRAECEAWADDEIHYEGVAGGHEYLGGQGKRRKVRLWTSGEMYRAHVAYSQGQRDDWAEVGHRAYLARRRRRAEGRSA